MVNLKIIKHRSNQRVFVILSIILILYLFFIIFDLPNRILLPVRQVRVGSEFAREFNVNTEVMLQPLKLALLKVILC